MITPPHASKGAANTALRGSPAGLVPAGFFNSFVRGSHGLKFCPRELRKSTQFFPEALRERAIPAGIGQED
jgi:hypothetical protein